MLRDYLKDALPSGSGSNGRAVSDVAAAIAEDCPHVAALMTSDRDSEDKLRAPTTLLLFVEAGALKYCLNDKSTAMCGWGSLQDHTGILEGVEADIRDGRVDWRKKRHTRSG